MKINIKIILLLAVAIISCENDEKSTSKGEGNATTLTFYSNDSVKINLMKIYDVATMDMKQEEVNLNKNKKFIVKETLDQLLFCAATSDLGAQVFYIDPDKPRSIHIKKNDDGALKFVFEDDDFINKITQSFQNSLNILFSFNGNESDFFNAVEDTETKFLEQLKEKKSKLNDSSYKTLKAMIVGKMAHVKFIFSERFKPSDAQSSYYNFTDNISFDNDNYLIYSDNINTLLSTVKIKFERKYNQSFDDSENKLDFINDFIKSDMVKSQLIAFLISEEIPKKSKAEKQKIMTDLKKMGVMDKYYQHLVDVKAGTALGAIAGSQVKLLESLTPINKNFSIDSLKGKSLFIDNWATWCGPCMKSMKEFHSKYKQLSNVEDIIFVFVSFDRSETIWKKYIDKNNFPEDKVVHLYNGFDLKSKYGKYYNILELPRYIFVDKSGIIKDLTPPNPSSEHFVEYIKKASSGI